MFVLKDLRFPKCFLGIELIGIDHETAGLCQPSLIMELISINGKDKASQSTYPMSPSDLRPEDTTLLDEEQATHYWSIFGSLLYNALKARPNISASASIPSTLFLQQDRNIWLRSGAFCPISVVQFTTFSHYDLLRIINYWLTRTLVGVVRRTMKVRAYRALSFFTAQLQILSQAAVKRLWH